MSCGARPLQGVGKSSSAMSVKAMLHKIRSQGKTILIDLGPESEKLSHCLKKARVSSLDAVFLSHFDADHVGGVLALREIPVGQLVVSGFRDDRPLVELVGKVA